MILVLLYTLRYRWQDGPGKQIARDREIMTLGRIKAILDQTCLIWTTFLVKDKAMYPKPRSSHDCFTGNCTFSQTSKENLSFKMADMVMSTLICLGTDH